MEKIQVLDSELEAELAKRQADLRFGLEKGEALFEDEVLRRHRELKILLSTYVLKAPPLVILTAPFIYALIIPFVCWTCSSPFICLSDSRFTAFQRCAAATSSSSTVIISPT